MLEDGATGDLPEPFAGESEAPDQALQRSRKHVLIARLRVTPVAAGERNPVAADNDGLT